MAEGWTRSVRCRYYTNGMCRAGDTCRYLHEGPPGRGPGPSTDMSQTLTRNTSTSSSSACCRFYQRGICTYGDNCRFSHAIDGAPSRTIEISGNSIVAASTGRVPSPIHFVKSEPGPSQKFTILKKQGNSADSGLGEDTIDNWANAPEFIPACVPEITPEPSQPTPALRKSYAEVCNPNRGKPGTSKNKLCPFLEAGECKYGAECGYIHGNLCDLCGRNCLHPTDKDQQKKHIAECIKQHEHDMELSFAIARSKDKTCGICFEIVLEKDPREQRFGILPNCNHCFCLTCIRKWRAAKQFDNKIIRACPECRVSSDFVCPSMYWVDTKEDKEKLILDYQKALSVKDCKYFKAGRGKCPFGNKCFYLHAYPDGTRADVGPPIRHRRHNADGEIDVLQSIILWDYIDERESRWLYTIDELEDLVTFISDSDESEWSEYDLYFD